MSTTSKTFRHYFSTNVKVGATFWIAAFFWPIGLLLQDVLTPLIASRAINKLISVGSSPDYNYFINFWPYVLGFLVTGLVGQVFIASSLVALSKAEVKGYVALSKKVYDHLLSLPMSFHNNTFAGSLVTQTSRFTNGYIPVTDAVIINFLELIVKSVLALIILAIFAPRIALFMFVWSVLFMIANYMFTKHRVVLSKAAAAADSKVTGQLADSISNIGAVKSTAKESFEKQRYMTLAKERGARRYAAWVHAIKTGVFTATMLTIMNAVVLAMSINGIATGSLDFGTLTLAQVYAGMLASVLWGFSRMIKGFEQSLSDAAEMTEILEIEPDVKDPKKPVHFKPSKGAIEFNNVIFTHDGAPEPLFNNLNLSIKPGEKVGLVGPSGGGKTTLTKILLRFSDIDSGSINIDGTNIAEVRQTDLRAAISYVPQEPLLFHRTLHENISYGKLDATTEEIRKAAKNAHAAEFIENLPDTYETLVGERGVKLSGGQRQRVAIARAMLKDGPILVLDEATSALDSESEALIQDALWKLMEGRTAVVIAHRLSTIQKMDRIIVLEHGKISEQGTHDELVKNGGTYARLWSHQSGGFLVD